MQRQIISQCKYLENSACCFTQESCDAPGATGDVVNVAVNAEFRRRSCKLRENVRRSV